MSGPFGSSQWMYNPSAEFYGTEIDGSLRFNDNDSAYLNRTPSSAGNRKTWTWSGWIKRGNLGLQGIFEANHSKDNQTALLFENSHQLLFTDRPSDVRNIDLRTTALFRDVSAWYHIVVRVDTTQATASNRVRLYVNGDQITSFATSNYPSQNYDVAFWNNTSSHRLGYQQGNSGNYLDGYMSEVNFVDGQSLEPTSFGETKSGIWIPKAYSGSYGTNGFHLEFAGNANDSSGNGNNWTANNISSHDYVPDSPTNNFCTLNGVTPYSTNIFEGNLKGNTGNSNNPIISSFKLPNTGKWYWEVRVISSDELTIGIRKNSPNLLSAPQTHYYRYGPEGLRVEGNLKSPGVNSLSGGDIVGVAFNADDSEISWYHNGTLQNQAYALADIEDLVAIVSQGSGSGDTWGHFNFGQDSTFAGSTTAGNNADANGIGDFKYAPPSGFLALCTANLPDPAIDPAADETPEDYFNTVTYSGTNGVLSVTGVGFQPDWVWIKKRNGASVHVAQDAVRGSFRYLQPDNTNAENTSSANDWFRSFDSDGFTVSKTNTGGTATTEWNNSGDSYASWNWLAGNGTSSNTNGSVTSTVSANTKAGFSIVGWTATGSAHTVGHGLNQAPEALVYKNRDRGAEWAFGHIDVGFNKYMPMDKNAAAATASNVFNSTAPTSSVFSVGTYPLNGDDVIAYCFHSVEGFSKIGTYTGNGSTDGVFVYTGFRPAFVLVKRTDASGTWELLDNKRDPNNVAGKQLFPDLANSEFSGLVLDMVSNGFKLRDGSNNHNTSGGNYIYMAFAEQPFKYANAR